MGFDILLDASGDLPHRPALAAGIEVVAQRVRLRLLRFRGDLILNVKKGIDYPGLLQTRPVDTDAIEALIVAELSGTEGLKSIEEVSAVFIRAAGYLTALRDGYTARLNAAGLSTSVDFSDDEFLGMITGLLSVILGEADETIQAVYDARLRGNAIGAQLDVLGIVVGVIRNEATASVATVTLTGATGTVIPAGKILEGGGTNGDQRWTIDADVTLAGGTGTATVTAENTGRIVALAASIDKIVTPVVGLDSVSNAADAIPGLNLESDAAYRARQQSSLQISGGSSTDAIRANVAAIDDVKHVAVIENDRSIAVVTGGISLDPHSYAVIVNPTLTTAAQKKVVAEAIFKTAPAGIKSMGTDVVASVTAIDGASKIIRFDFSDNVTVNVGVTLTLDSGYVVADVNTEIINLITDYIDGDATEDPPVVGLSIGENVRHLPILSLIAGVKGVLGAVLLLSGLTTDIPIGFDEIAVTGTVTVL